MPIIRGTLSDDVLNGTVGDDVITDAWGDDIIDAAAGNDTIIDQGGSNVIRGGTGNDFIDLRLETYGGTVYSYSRVSRTNLVDAGEGNDVVHVSARGRQDIAVNLGAGADLLTMSFMPSDRLVVTTGEGADRIVLKGSEAFSTERNFTPYTITDFTVGPGGDILDMGESIEQLLKWWPHEANPFADGRLVLIQDGADTLVQVQFFGADYGPTSRLNIIRLTNVDAADLTAYNLAGYDPSGSGPVREIVEGTAESEWINANVGGADLRGHGGNDRLTGNVGDDAIFGGADNDVLGGGSGNDALDGGIGNDTLDGGAGNDILRGGDGDDVLSDPSGSDILDAGAGNDTIDIVRDDFIPNFGPVTILAGDGDDFVRFDLHHHNRSGGSLSVDLGAGNDRFVVPGNLDDVRLTLGSGQDHVQFAIDHTPLVITDFNAGNAGDVLELDSFFVRTNISNPFAEGSLFLQQDGADTLVLWDYDGSGPTSFISVLARLENVNAGSLTAFNFGGYAPDGSPSSFTLLQGGPGNDRLYGTNAADTINAGDGDDFIEELKGGSDTLNGGGGNDTIVVRHYSPEAVENVTINAGAGNDFVDAAAGSGNLTVDLGAGDDRIVLSGSNDFNHSITLGTGSDVVEIPDTFNASVTNAPVIVDFQTGNGGDRLEWATYVEHENFNGSADYNPFLEGEARLVQDGSDVHLEIAGFLSERSTPIFTKVLTFANTTVSAFTAFNLGYDLYFPTQAGGIGDDILNGTVAADVLHGNAGNDQLNGDGGDDILWGHGGADTLRGGIGNDYLRGGDDNDVLDGGDGADVLDGGNGADTIDGGNGADTIYDWYGADAVSAGSGDDQIHVEVAHNTSASVLGSLTAGDGNDLVEISNPDARTGYLIDLGAGDDTIRFEDYATAPITLGAGRDLVTGLARNTIVINDFETGSSGDVIDLASLIDRELGYILQNTDWDPFAAGYVQLKQVGTEVRLYVYPEGYIATQFPQVPAIRFLNTNLSDFTSANFGGEWNPHAAPSRVIQLAGDYTNGVNRFLDDVTPVSFVGSTAFMFNWGANATLTNHATVTLLQDRQSGGSAIGVWGGPGPTGSTFVNASDGVFAIHYAYVPPGGDLTNNGFTTARGTYRIDTVRNDGVFQVTASMGVAYGVEEATLINTGSFTVTSAYAAYGLYNRNIITFSNTGTINVHGDEFAVGLYFGDVRTTGLTNAGTINVTTAPRSAHASVGIYVSESVAPPGEVFEYFNSGTITADIAFFVSNDHTTNLLGKDILHNSGTMNGNVVLSFGDDTVDNTGTISGTVLLGAGNDRYDGALGQNHGSVEGGTGNDRLIGGDNDDVLFGDEGDDTIFGGLGDDFIEGGLGSDKLAGNAGGGDFLSYAESLLAVSIDLAAGSVSDGIDIDQVSGFEGVIGSRFDDAMRGGSSAEIILGGDGDDLIDGGAGADTLRGERGTDHLAGGSSADTFLFSIGDGADVIRDFGAGDRLAIHGYATAPTITQVGSNVVVVLSGTDRITLLNTTSALVQASLSQSAQPLGSALPFFDRAIVAANDSLVIPAGVTVSLSDPADLQYRNSVIPGQGILLASVGTTNANPDFFNSGTFNFIDSGQPQITGISKHYMYGSDQNNFVNDATGSILVHNLSGDAIGIAFITHTFNFGSISVVSDGGDATGFTDLPSGAYDENYFVNAGSLSVRATGTALGVGQIFGSSASTDNLFNSGVIAIHGEKQSTGLQWITGTHPASTERPFLTNSGQIVVTDGTTALDSAAIRLDWHFDSTLWNSGLLQGDYALKRTVAVTGAGIDGTLSIFNSGEMIGHVDLYGGFGQTLVLINTGSIHGNVRLANGDDRFDGRAGRLSGILSGEGGNDTLLAGVGSQIILGGSGNDILSGGRHSDTLTGGTGSDHFRYEDGFGIDTITDFEASVDRVDVRGYAAWQSIAQQGADVIVTFAAGEQLIFKNQQLANINSNVFSFGVSAIAASSIPRAPVAPAAPFMPITEATAALAPIHGTAASNTLNGTEAAEALSGAAGNDTLNGGAGNDRLDGGTGNDFLDGGSGFDIMSGGAGNDVYVVDNVFDILTEREREGADSVQSSIDYALGQHLENLTLTGSAVVSGMGNELANTMRGNAGHNVLIGGGGDDYLFGNAGDDSLSGDAGYDRMYGGLGNDTYFVGDFSDFAYENAGEGRDLVVSSIDLTLRDNVEDLTLNGPAAVGKGNSLDNVISGNAGGNKLYGFEGNDTLSGLAGDDYLFGSAGNDILTGGEGYDRMYGGVGDDTYHIVDSTDFSYENLGEGNDRVVSSLVSYQLRTHVEELTLAENSGAIRGYGQAADNVINGNSAGNFLYGRDGNDTIRGNAGNDIVYGENGEDTLYGGTGQDRFYGGMGADKFVFRNSDFAGMTSSTADRIHDFNSAQGDTIHLTGVDANWLLEGDQAFAFIGDAAFSKKAGELRAYQTAGTTYVSGDVDGDGVADFVIRMDGIHSLHGGDFYL